MPEAEMNDLEVLLGIIGGLIALAFFGRVAKTKLGKRFTEWLNNNKEAAIGIISRSGGEKE